MGVNVDAAAGLDWIGLRSMFPPFQLEDAVSVRSVTADTLQLFLPLGGQTPTVDQPTSISFSRNFSRFLPEYEVLFTQPLVLTQKLGVLRRHFGLCRKHFDPLAEGRMPNPQIRRNLTPCQAAGLRNANRSPLELVGGYRCHIRSP